VAAAPPAPLEGPEAAQLNTPLPWTQPGEATLLDVRVFTLHRQNRSVFERHRHRRPIESTYQVRERNPSALVHAAWACVGVLFGASPITRSLRQHPAHASTGIRNITLPTRNEVDVHMGYRLARAVAVVEADIDAVEDEPFAQ